MEIMLFGRFNSVETIHGQDTNVSEFSGWNGVCINAGQHLPHTILIHRTRRHKCPRKMGHSCNKSMVAFEPYALFNIHHWAWQL